MGVRRRASSPLRQQHAEPLAAAPPASPPPPPSLLQLGGSPKSAAAAAASSSASVSSSVSGGARSSATRPHPVPHPPRWFPAATTYLAYAVLLVFGHLRDYIGKLTGWSRYFGANNRPAKGYAPLLQDWENFFTRRMYHRIQDCWNRPIAGPPFSGKLQVIQRSSSDGNKTLRPVEGAEPVTCINLGSYNYLGFADDWHETCRTSVMATSAALPLSMCTSPAEGGYTVLHETLEASVAAYVGKEAAIVFNMGFATNSLGLPCLGGKGTLLVSDNLNHNSIVTGARASGAAVRVYRHDDYRGLESLLRSAVVEGQDRTHRPWRKIVILVEGIYSMEGEMCNLNAVVALAKRYKAYVYLDEAHSIGALGATGRGLCEQKGVNPADVDILMGTFTKSFGAMGGYMAGSRAFIDYVRSSSAGFLADNAMSPVVVQQILTALSVMKGEDGTHIGAEKLRRLRDNSNYMRQGLIDLGCEVYGEWDSPVIPVMIYNPTKIAAFSRECLKRGIAAVVVGFPATPLITSRVRFCVSAGHTREELDEALGKIAEVCDLLKLRYRKSLIG